MVELRTIVQELIDYQLNDYPEDAIAQKQRELNVAYDRFADQYGLINSRANAQAFSEDSSYYLLCSLENVDENGRLESKADMFTKRTIRPERGCYQRRYSGRGSGNLHRRARQSGFALYVGAFRYTGRI